MTDAPMDPSYSRLTPDRHVPICRDDLVLDTRAADAVLPEDGGLLALELRVAAAFDFQNGAVALRRGNRLRSNQLSNSALTKIERATKLESAQ